MGQAVGIGQTLPVIFRLSWWSWCYSCNILQPFHIFSYLFISHAFGIVSSQGVVLGFRLWFCVSLIFSYPLRFHVAHQETGWVGGSGTGSFSISVLFTSHWSRIEFVNSLCLLLPLRILWLFEYRSIIFIQSKFQFFPNLFQLVTSNSLCLILSHFVSR